MGNQCVTSPRSDFYQWAGAKNPGDGLRAFLTFFLQVLLHLIPDVNPRSGLGSEGMEVSMDTGGRDHFRATPSLQL